MHDQSHGRINGSAAAAFATICKRNRNTVSVLKSAGEFDGVSWGSGMHRDLRIRQEQSTNNFATSAPPPTVPTIFFAANAFNDTAIWPIDRCRQRENRGPTI